MKALILSALLTIPLYSKTHHAPLPERLISAKTVMLYGGPPQVLDQAADELRKWGRFTIVTEKSQADLIFEFLWISQPDNGRTVYHESLVVYDSKTGDALYQDAQMSEPTGIFTLIPGRSMARRMIKGLKKRIEKSTSLSSSFPPV